MNFLSLKSLICTQIVYKRLIKSKFIENYFEYNSMIRHKDADPYCPMLSHCIISISSPTCGFNFPRLERLHNTVHNNIPVFQLAPPGNRLIDQFSCLKFYSNILRLAQKKNEFPRLRLARIAVIVMPTPMDCARVLVKAAFRGNSFTTSICVWFPTSV